MVVLFRIVATLLGLQAIRLDIQSVLAIGGLVPSYLVKLAVRF
jgi:hypothetical protein